ncbi:helix-turn-helix transcriptional regulator [Streptosporangium sp. NPDC000563]|uniref:helix-turn-helix domain-containing protein n=1 Tax=Streptosporangium sp. NPDC000563 TaxID=3154366 RepID=UPI003331A374
MSTSTTDPRRTSGRGSLSPARQAAEALGRRLREIRTGANLTGRALAAEAGRHYSKVSRSEHSGKTPTEEELRISCRICDPEDWIPETYRPWMRGRFHVSASVPGEGVVPSLRPFLAGTFAPLAVRVVHLGQ